VPTDDHYAGAAAGWATGAAKVYGPLARELVRRSPHSLSGHVVIDLGAGTGLVSDVLVEAGARAVAIDLSIDMLSWQRAKRPPSAVAEVGSLPFRDHGVDDLVAAFVLNHVTEPIDALREMTRVVRPGGIVLADVYSNDSRSAARDAIDQVALGWGMCVPGWYSELKAAATPLLGSSEAMRRATESAGLVTIEVDEVAVDVGVHSAEELVAYRTGQANYAEFVASLTGDDLRAFRREATAAARPLMTGPYQPIVVFLSARVP
jgi:SAM-dependent methyltransferase